MQASRDEIFIGIVSALRDRLNVVKCCSKPSELLAAIATFVIISLENLKPVLFYIVVIKFPTNIYLLRLALLHCELGF